MASRYSGSGFASRGYCLRWLINQLINQLVDVRDIWLTSVKRKAQSIRGNSLVGSVINLTWFWFLLLGKLSDMRQKGGSKSCNLIGCAQDS